MTATEKKEQASSELNYVKSAIDELTNIDEESCFGPVIDKQLQTLIDAAEEVKKNMQRKIDADEFDDDEDEDEE